MSRVRFYKGTREFVLSDGAGEYGFKSDVRLSEGDCIVIEGEQEGSWINASSVIVLDIPEADMVLSAISEKVRERMPASPLIVDDDVSKKLWPAMSDAAAKLLLAKKLGRRLALRFHGDADGISGAFALTGIVHCKASQQNSAVYSVKDALYDISSIGQENRPLIILLDFGANDASGAGLELLKAAGIEYLIIDHHPLGKKPPENLISPFSVADDVSRYTAGYLACEIAVACGMGIKEAKELACVACAGDKSKLLENGEDEAKRAMVLDFLAAHISFGNNLDFYKKVMETPELFKSISNQADESITEAAGKAISRMKTVKSGETEIVSFDLEHIVTKGEWPPASKITTRVFDTLKGDSPLICIGMMQRTLIIRLNDAAAKAGLSANDLAKEIVSSMPDFVEGGGGHVRAGAIRVRQGFAKEVLSQLIARIG